jgi:hypothetical protein
MNRPGFCGDSDVARGGSVSSLGLAPATTARLHSGSVLVCVSRSLDRYRLCQEAFHITLID